MRANSFSYISNAFRSNKHCFISFNVSYSKIKLISILNGSYLMISKYKPEGWVVLTFQTIDDKPCYVLFCSWKSDDVWRVSSGSMVLPHFSSCGNYWIWPQISGSTYELPVDEENGYTFYTGAVLDDLLAKGYRDGTHLKRIALKDIMGAK